jgi:hypothetical protein
VVEGGIPSLLQTNLFPAVDSNAVVTRSLIHTDRCLTERQEDTYIHTYIYFAVQRTGKKKKEKKKKEKRRPHQQQQQQSKK